MSPIFKLTFFALFLLIKCNSSESLSTANYLFYLHGRIIEEQGVNAISEKFGEYEYQSILNRFEKDGFNVISEARPKDTDIDFYSNKVVEQVDSLLKSNVKAHNISILGASKGAVIAMLTSSKLKKTKVNFILMGNCNEWVQNNFDINLHGNVLSIYEESDTFGQSCKVIKSNSTSINSFEEVILNTNLGHGFLYKPLGEWVVPVVNWIKRNSKNEN